MVRVDLGRGLPLVGVVRGLVGGEIGDAVDAAEQAHAIEASQPLIAASAARAEGLDVVAGGLSNPRDLDARARGSPAGKSTQTAIWGYFSFSAGPRAGSC